MRYFFIAYVPAHDPLDFTLVPDPKDTTSMPPLETLGRSLN